MRGRRYRRSRGRKGKQRVKRTYYMSRGGIRL